MDDLILLTADNGFDINGPTAAVIVAWFAFWAFVFWLWNR